MIARPARAGLLEFLSEASYSVSSNPSCSAYDEAKARSALDEVAGVCSADSAPGLAKNVRQLSAVSQAGTEDVLFAELAKQHSSDLRCAADFARDVSADATPSSDDLRLRFRQLRAARQELNNAVQELMAPGLGTKVCPMALEAVDRDLSPMDPARALCSTIIRSRLAFQAIFASIPLSGVPAVRSFAEKYANSREDSMDDAALSAAIKGAYAQGRTELQTQAGNLERTVGEKGGAGLDRGARYALLQDPRTLESVVKRGGGSEDLKGLACRANARYGTGADNLDTAMFVGSLAFSGGAGLIGRAGSIGAKIWAGANGARAAGLISLGAARALQFSAAAAGSIASYQQIDRQCFSSGPGLAAAGACESTPKISQIPQDGCVLQASLEAIGYAGGAVSLYKTARSLTREGAAVAAAETRAAAAAERQATAQPATSHLGDGREIPSGGTLTPSTTRTDGVAAKAEPVSSARQTATAVSTRNQEALIARYNEKVYVSEAGNNAFIGRMNAAAAGKAKLSFFEVENSAMKRLNDTLKDKNLVTSLTNLHKEGLLREIDGLKAKYPNLEITPYSDFKAVKLAIAGTDRMTPAELARFRQDLDAAFQRANRSFAEKVRAENLVGASEKPDQWFRAGFGSTHDEASLAARRGRTVDGRESNRMMDFNSPEVADHMAARLAQVETRRSELVSSPAFQSLMEHPTDGSAAVPRADVLALTRKYSDPHTLAQAVQTRYGVSGFTSQDATKLQHYASQVDEFSPSLVIAKRNVVNMDRAEQGGFSIDVLGMGADNMQATAKALAGQNDLRGALRATRAGEGAVTTRVDTIRAKIKRAGGDFIECTGEDCVGLARTAMTPRQKQELLTRFAADPDTRRIRVAFIPPGVSEIERSRLAAQGEAIEKLLRSKLEMKGGIPFSRLEKTTLGIDMDTTRLNQGNVSVLVGTSGDVRLTAKEIQEINQTLAEVLEIHNRSLQAESGIAASYRASSSSLPRTGTRERVLELVP